MIHRVSFVIIFTILFCSNGAVFGNDTNLLIKFVVKSVALCANKRVSNFMDCIKERSLIGLDSFSKSQNEIQLFTDTISLIKNNDINQNQDSSIWDEINLIKNNSNNENRTHVVDKLLFKAIENFVTSRSVNIKIPVAALDVFDSESQGRGKKDKGGHMMIAMMMGGMAIAGKMAMLAALSGKALMTSMLAFMLAAIATLKKSGATHGSTTYEVINVPPSGHGHHGRSGVVSEQLHQNSYKHASAPTEDYLLS